MFFSQAHKLYYHQIINIYFFSCQDFSLKKIFFLKTIFADCAYNEVRQIDEPKRFINNLRNTKNMFICQKNIFIEKGERRGWRE